ncbi:hypothetical protein ElyMa_005846300 [Elysia marginata]|uniref:Uncharacterized protein n=1 Tax=Elysia marginata TaxID=1093978 RepID=A0AAV4G017_9GAST|nr:hypothetical protein ElyMa_005846300 [Elysia marginata]
MRCEPAQEDEAFRAGNPGWLMASQGPLANHPFLPWVQLHPLPSQTNRPVRTSTPSPNSFNISPANQHLDFDLPASSCTQRSHKACAPPVCDRASVGECACAWTCTSNSHVLACQPNHPSVCVSGLAILSTPLTPALGEGTRAL